MRFVLAVLAVMALVAGPVAATAMRATCSDAPTHAMTGMGMAPSSAAVVAGDPCCDPANQTPQTDKSCARACAALGVVGIETPRWPVSVPFAYRAQPPAKTPSAIVRAFQPVGLERPPKVTA